MNAGGSPAFTFTFTTGAPGGVTPYSISGATWEYVARVSQTDATVPPAVKITTTLSVAGLITVTSTAALSQVQLQFYGAATASLAPGTYWHALWMNPGGTTPVPIFGGLNSELIIEGTPEP